MFSYFYIFQRDVETKVTEERDSPLQSSSSFPQIQKSTNLSSPFRNLAVSSQIPPTRILPIRGKLISPTNSSARPSSPAKSHGKIFARESVLLVPLSSRRRNHSGEKSNTTRNDARSIGKSLRLQNNQTELKDLLLAGDRDESENTGFKTDTISSSPSYYRKLSSKYMFKLKDSLSERNNVSASNMSTNQIILDSTENISLPVKKVIELGNIYSEVKNNSTRLLLSEIRTNTHSKTQTLAPKSNRNRQPFRKMFQRTQYMVHPSSNRMLLDTSFQQQANEALTYSRLGKRYTTTSNARTQGSDSSSSVDLPIELMPIYPGGGSRFDDWEREKLERDKMAQKKDKSSNRSKSSKDTKGDGESDESNTAATMSSFWTFDFVHIVKNSDRQSQLHNVYCNNNTFEIVQFIPNILDYKYVI